jgi:hypothetical protein
LVEEQITQNQDGPSVADDIEGPGNWTFETVLSGHLCDCLHRNRVTRYLLVTILKILFGAISLAQECLELSQGSKPLCQKEKH